MPGGLSPLTYPTEIAARLASLEPDAWRVFAEAVRSANQPRASNGPSDGDELDAALLRHAYRMEAESHPRVHAAASRAAAALGVDLPIVIFQLEGSDGANAFLVYRPHEVVLALSGNALTLLTDEELTACMAHELAHHVLWTADANRLLVADRLLDALAIDPGTPAVYLETARRFDLATELFADRGALLASGDLPTSISSVVKLATGLADVDAGAFLRQADAAHPERGTSGMTHPETVLRAWALARWEAGDGDAAAQTLLSPTLDIERLDLLDRERLEQLTHRLIQDVLEVDWMRTQAILGHARQFMPELATTEYVGTRSRGRFRRGSDAESAQAGPVQAHVPEDAPTETRRYLAYVLLDLATVDPELDDEPLVEVLAVAREAGLAPAFEEVARRELTIAARPWDALVKRSLERRSNEPPL